MLAPCYLVHGGEPQQTEEIIKAIKQEASQTGFDNQIVFDITAQFNWTKVLESMQNLDLFATGTIFELRLHGETVNKESAQYLETILKQQDPAICVIIRAEQLRPLVLNHNWAKYIQQHGQIKLAKPIPTASWPNWVMQRLKQAGFAPAQEAVYLLAQAYEGNLPAAIQCINKIHDLLPSGRLELAQIQPFLHSDSHFSVFALANAILAGDSERVFIIFHSLQNDGVDPILMLWVVTQEIKKLLKLKNAIQAGINLSQSAQQLGIWRDALPKIKDKLDKITASDLERSLRICKSIDSAVKGITPGNVWDKLLALCLALTENNMYLVMEEAPI